MGNRALLANMGRSSITTIRNPTDCAIRAMANETCPPPNKNSVGSGQIDSKNTTAGSAPIATTSSKSSGIAASPATSSRTPASAFACPNPPALLPSGWINNFAPICSPPETSVANTAEPRALRTRAIASSIASARPGNNGSVKISTLPPQLRPFSPACFSVKINFCKVGTPASITCRASAHTSASKHPPPTVPTISPSARTSILAFLLIGNDPLLDTIVDNAAFSPRETRANAS